MVRLTLLRPKLILVAPETGQAARRHLRRFLRRKAATVLTTRHPDTPKADPG